jgi:hypothetical protein
VVYRHHAREIAQGEKRGGLLLHVDASGQKGGDGRHGAPGSSGGGYGSAGSRGGDAGPAQRGQDAGWVRVRLEPSGESALVAAGDRSLGPAAERFVEEVAFGESGSLLFSAVGGDGGHGGHGGRGGDGASGRPGSDATRYSSGTDGGPGGPGGDGGRATSGADGGSGGHVRVQVDDTATHLLMLVEHRIHGGRGGNHGTHGEGGSGGSGGRGGSSYSWTESESYTDSEGNRRTRTTHHRNPGGSSGRSGMPGSRGHGHLADGTTGQEGSFLIEVVEDGETRSYPARYDLRLLAFNHESENADTVYEPQEKVRVYDVIVENCGGMPTPAHHDIELRLEQKGWVLPHDEALLVPRSLPPGARHHFKDEVLHFTIGDFRPEGPDAPLAHPEVIGHTAYLPAVCRGFDDYAGNAPEEQGNFVIRFPVESSHLESLHSLAPGQAARLRWSLTNISTLAFGRAAENGRRVRFGLAAHDSELGDDHACLLAPGDVRVPLSEGYIVELDRIEPGETRQFEATVGFFSDAPHYRSVSLWIALEIGYIDEPKKLRPIQYRRFDVRVGQRYAHRDDADLLLVVSHRTTRPEIDAWKEVCRDLGFTPAMWDASLEGGLPLFARRDGRRLAETFAGRTIVVLNDAIETAKGPCKVSDLIDKDELRRATEAGVSVAFVGRRVSLERLLIPTGVAAEPVDDKRAIEVLERALAERDRAALERVVDRCAVHCWSIFRIPIFEMVVWRAAQALSRRLARRYPELRFAVVHHTDWEKAGQVLFASRYRAGWLEVRGMVPTAAGQLVSAQVDDVAMRDPATVRGDTIASALLCTRSFDEKLACLDALLVAGEAPGSRPLAEVVRLYVDALLVDLATEQRAVLASRWRAGLSSKGLRDALPRLRKLAGHAWSAVGQVDPESAEGAELVRLGMAITYHAWAEWRFWEWLPPLPWLRRTPSLWWTSRSLARDALEGLFLHGEGKAAAARKKALAAAMKSSWRAIEASYRDAMGGIVSYRGRQRYIESRLAAPILLDGVTTDAEVLLGWEQRLFAHDKIAELEKKDRRRANRRVAMMQASADAGAELRRGQPTEALLEAAQPS